MKTKVVLCTFSSLYSSTVLRALLAADEVEVVGVVNSTRLLKKQYGLLSGARAMLRRSGWRYVAYHLWLTGMFALLQPLSSRKTIQRLCKEADIPVHHTADVNGAESIRFIRALNPDVLVSAYFNQLVHREVRELPRYGAINIHPSLLPDFRGADPVFHALLNESPNIGVTVHYMDESFDTGNIVRQGVMQVKAGASVLSHYDALFAHGAQLAIEALRQVRMGWPGALQAEGGAYLGWPDRQSVSTFHKRGRQLMTWKEYFGMIAK